jgi:hypothetical protein
VHTVRAWAALAAAAGGAACGTGSSFDAFPIGFDVGSGAVMAGAAEGADGAQLPALIDTLSPVTVIDDFQAGGEEQPPIRREIELRLFASGGTVPRAAFGGVGAFDLHLCTGVDGPCQVGVDGAVRDVRVVVGADALGEAAVRFDFAANQLRFFPDIAGDDTKRTEACDAVFPGALAGGGTLVFENSEIDFGARRLAIGACLAYDAETAPPAVRGTDTLFVVATGLPVSLISAAAWERYRAVVADDAVAPPADSLPAVTVNTASGAIAARLGSINRLALTGNGTGASEERGPCQELWAHHVMAAGVCTPEDETDVCSLCGDQPGALGPCPCPNRDDNCAVAASVELDRSFSIAIIDDLEPILQSLRFELAPELPDVDGFLAPGAIAPLQLDVDYPNGRALARCGDPTACVTRPQIGGKNSIEPVTACIGP